MELDWLRVLVILTVFVFHCGRFFDTRNWHVKNATRYEVLEIWTTCLAFWLPSKPEFQQGLNWLIHRICGLMRTSK